MRRFSTILFASALVMLAGAVMAVPAGAGPCPVGCALAKKADLQAARLSMLACKLDCRQNAAATDLGACNRACMDTLRAAKDAAQSDHTDCLGMCTPPAADPSLAPSAPDSCRGACGQGLASCAQDVVSAGKTCVTACRTAPDRLTCLQGCATAAENSADTCGLDFTTCTSNCPVPTPPGPVPTPGQTAAPACGNMAAPACGGVCANPGDSCRDVGGTCTCVAAP